MSNQLCPTMVGLDTKKSEIYVNTSRDIIRYFSAVASEDPVYKHVSGA